MKSNKSIIEKLFELGLINKKTRDKYNYELLNRIIKKKEENELNYIKSRKKETEFEVFINLVKEDKHSYSNEELVKILDAIENNESF